MRKRSSPLLTIFRRSDDKILFDNSQPMENVNRQLIRAKLNYAEVGSREKALERVWAI